MVAPWQVTRAFPRGGVQVTVGFTRAQGENGLETVVVLVFFTATVTRAWLSGSLHLGVARAGNATVWRLKYRMVDRRVFESWQWAGSTVVRSRREAWKTEELSVSGRGLDRQKTGQVRAGVLAGRRVVRFRQWSWQAE